MENKSVYALLIGVGDYEKMNIANLPTYRMDLSLLATSLLSGLKVPKDNLRIMAGADNNGYVTTTDLAKAIAGFKSLLGSEDTFIFYFSGHGRNRNILFSNGQVELQSVINFVEKLPAKNKIVILDCCYSGNFKTSGARIMHFEESMEEFVGHGIAIMASSAADEVSRLGPNGNHSMFTGALSTAIAINKKVTKGKTSLDDIYDEMMHLVKAWNRENPGKEQQPIFRSSLGGTIYFQVEEYHPYRQMEYSFENDEYSIVSVEPLSTLSIKRLCAFVIPKGKGELLELPDITRKVAEQIKYAEIYSTQKSEEILGGQPARAVWCYFGHDESDIINHLHYSYTIWAADEEMRQLYFKSNKNAVIADGIYIYENKDYNMLKKMQEPTQSREEFIEENKKLLAVIVTLAEKFVTDLQEVANNTLTTQDIQERYGEWTIKVRRKFIELSDGDIAPDDLHDWTEEIMNLAGWVADMALLIENEKGNGVIGDRENWLIKHAVSHYHESMEKIKKLEDEIEW